MKDILKKIFVSLPLGYFVEARIVIHYSFFISATLQIFLLSQMTEYGTYTNGLFVMIAAISIILHEAGHIAVARLFDVKTYTIYVTALGGFADMDKKLHRVTNPQEFFIALAGPVFSILIAISCLGLWSIIPADIKLLRDIVLFAALINFIFAGFNMIPILPMDGGRAVRALLAEYFGRLKATKILVYVSIPASAFFCVTLISHQAYTLGLILLIVPFISVAELRSAEVIEDQRKSKANPLDDDPQ